MARIAGKHSKTGLRMALAAGLVLATACAPLTRTHGFVPSEDELANLLVGVDTRDTVAETVGPPTAMGLLDTGDFYYVQSRYETVGPFAPREVERQIVAVTFTDAGIIRNIERIGLEQGREVEFSRRVTDDNIRDTTFLRQLMGNFGRVDAGTLLGEN